MDQSLNECKTHGIHSCYICSAHSELTGVTSTQVDVVETKQHKKLPCLGEIMMMLSMATMVLTIGIPVIMAWKIVLSGIVVTFVLMYFGSKIHDLHKPREGETTRVIVD